MQEELLIIANAVRTKMVISATGFGSNVQNVIDLFNMSNDMLIEIGAKIKERITKKTDVFEMEDAAESPMQKQLKAQFALVQAVYKVKITDEKEKANRDAVRKAARERLSHLRAKEGAVALAAIEAMTPDQIAAAIAEEEAKL